MLNFKVTTNLKINEKKNINDLPLECFSGEKASRLRSFIKRFPYKSLILRRRHFIPKIRFWAFFEVKLLYSPKYHFINKYIRSIKTQEPYFTEQKGLVKNYINIYQTRYNSFRVNILKWGRLKERILKRRGVRKLNGVSYTHNRYSGYFNLNNFSYLLEVLFSKVFLKQGSFIKTNIFITTHSVLLKLLLNYRAVYNQSATTNRLCLFFKPFVRNKYLTRSRGIKRHGLLGSKKVKVNYCNTGFLRFILYYLRSTELQRRVCSSYYYYMLYLDGTNNLEGRLRWLNFHGKYMVSYKYRRFITTTYTYPLKNLFYTRVSSFFLLLYKSLFFEYYYYSCKLIILFAPFLVYLIRLKCLLLKRRSLFKQMGYLVKDAYFNKWSRLNKRIIRCKKKISYFLRIFYNRLLEELLVLVDSKPSPFFIGAGLNKYILYSIIGSLATAYRRRSIVILHKPLANAVEHGIADLLSTEHDRKLNYAGSPERLNYIPTVAHFNRRGLGNFNLNRALYRRQYFINLRDVFKFTYCYSFILFRYGILFRDYIDYIIVDNIVISRSTEHYNKYGDRIVLHKGKKPYKVFLRTSRWLYSMIDKLILFMYEGLSFIYSSTMNYMSNVADFFTVLKELRSKFYTFKKVFMIDIDRRYFMGAHVKYFDCKFSRYVEHNFKKKLLFSLIDRKKGYMPYKDLLPILSSSNADKVTAHMSDLYSNPAYAYSAHKRGLRFLNFLFKSYLYSLRNNIYKPAVFLALSKTRLGWSHKVFRQHHFTLPHHLKLRFFVKFKEVNYRIFHVSLLNSVMQDTYANQFFSKSSMSLLISSLYKHY